ncbi:NAD(P)H-quinone oxidoreductase [Salinibacterium sp. GXW1014]|uniref:NAD(P)H-quinone oxidoreductase n=1 Tax=Salinibacterium sp. GXW1014 TaxID=3377838 RepID=UPI00383B9AFA
MRAVVATGPAEHRELEIIMAPIPLVHAGDVLIKVSAAGVNRADVMQRKGNYDPPPGETEILGLECSGTIVAAGKDVDPGLLGAEVCALLAGGAYAEYVSVPAEHVLPVPEGVSLLDAAGIIEAAATVWSNVFALRPLASGIRVLVHGGSSGIGSMAIQMARAFGAAVSATVGSAEKAAFCRRLGADDIVNYREVDFAEAFAASGQSFDVILDMVGGDYVDRNLGLLDRGGHLAIIGLQGGVRASVALEPLLQRNLTITGRGLRTRPRDEKTRILSELRRHVWPLFASGAASATTYRTFDLAEAMEAHRLMEESSHLGKLLLTIDHSQKDG